MTKTYDIPPLPVPGERVGVGGPIQKYATVIASTYVGIEGNDDGWMLLVLFDRPPFYGLWETPDPVTHYTGTFISLGTFMNINDAVAAYADNGGDV
jgi:hypothetical protein